MEDKGFGPCCVTIVLIRPSRYDDDGYVVRYRKGFLPSNTPSCLCGLPEEARRQRALGSVRLETRLLDDTIQPIPVRAIARVPGRSSLARAPRRALRPGDPMTA